MTSDATSSDALGQRLTAGFSKIALALRHRAWREAHGADLTPTQGQVLVVLERHPGAGLAEVAGQLGVRPSTASEAVAALCEKGLVAKERSPQDRRQICLQLTSEGRKSATEAGLWPDFLARAADGLPEEEARVLLKALQRMIRTLERRGEISTTRMCSTCTFFRPHRHGAGAKPHHCAFIDAPIGDLDLRFDCADHEKAETEAAAEAFFRA